MQCPRNVNQPHPWPCTHGDTMQQTKMYYYNYEVGFSFGRLPSWISIDWKILLSATQNLDPHINE